ncbi:MAG: Hpt domain-containing protein [Lachnospiraceae bacterium]|nr:Hpt domain-containing protein [Lachnospiraceae bacterium]
MEESIKEGLIRAGVNVEELNNRIMGNETLIFHFLKQFLKDENYTTLVSSMDCDDVEGAFHAAHTLKGVCGNLSLQSLSKEVCPLVEDLRNGDIEAAREKMPEFKKVYTQLIEDLEHLLP